MLSLEKNHNPRPCLLGRLPKVESETLRLSTMTAAAAALVLAVVVVGVVRLRANRMRRERTRGVFTVDFPMQAPGKRYPCTGGAL